MTHGLHQAIKDCRFHHVRYLLESGVNIHVKNQKGENVLVTAMQIENLKKQRKMFAILLDKGARCSDRDSATGRDVLSWACFHNLPILVNVILKDSLGDIDYARKDKHGFTSLHYATRSGNPHLVRSITKAMTKFGLSVDIPDNHGLTPYLHAKRLGFKQAADILHLEGHASVSQFDTSLFMTADHWTKLQTKPVKKSTRINELSKFDKMKVTRAVTMKIIDKDTKERKGKDPQNVMLKGIDSALKYKVHCTYLNTVVENEEHSNVPNMQYLCQPFGTSVKAMEEFDIEMKKIMEMFQSQISPSYRKHVVLPPVQKTSTSTGGGLATLAFILRAVNKQKKRIRGKVAINKFEKDFPKKIVKRRSTVAAMHAPEDIVNIKNIHVQSETKQHRKSSISMSKLKDTCIDQ